MPFTGQTQTRCGINGDAGDYLRQRHTDGEKFRHHVRQAVYRAVDAVATIDIGADGVRQNALGNRLARHRKTEAGAAVADIQLHAARDRLLNRRFQLALR